MPASSLRLILAGKMVDEHAILAACPSFHKDATLCLFIQSGAPAELSRVASSRMVQGTLPPQALYFSLRLVNAEATDNEDSDLPAIQLFESVSEVQVAREWSGIVMSRAAAAVVGHTRQTARVGAARRP